MLGFDPTRHVPTRGAVRSEDVVLPRGIRAAGCHVACEGDGQCARRETEQRTPSAMAGGGTAAPRREMWMGRNRTWHLVREPAFCRRRKRRKEGRGKNDACYTLSTKNTSCAPVKPASKNVWGVSASNTRRGY